MSYKQHAWRHHPTKGTDPIASSSDLPFASLRHSTTYPTITAGAGDTYISMQDGISGVHFWSSDADIFDNSSTTLFTGSPLYGIGVLQPGTYRYDWAVQLASGGTNGKRLTTYWSSSGTAILSGLLQGRTGYLIGDNWDPTRNDGTFWTEYQSFDTGGNPGVAVPYCNLEAGSSSASVSIALVVTRISSKYDPQL